MTDTQENFDDKLSSLLRVIASEGVQNAARGFSGMLGKNLTVKEPTIRLIPLSEIPSTLGGPEKEAVGIYLRADGQLIGQIMLIVPIDKAMELVDMLMDVPAGTTQTLGSLERSALAEVGNITASFFLNTVASITGLEVVPTPPAVMVDMVGAILDIVVATIGGVVEQVLILQTMFMCGTREVEANFWVIPDPSALASIRLGG
jgi:chemotaxis protein CheC